MEHDVLAAIHEELDRAQRLPFPKLLELIRQKEMALGSPLPAFVEPIIFEFNDPPFNFLKRPSSPTEPVDNTSVTSTFIPIKASQHRRQMSVYSLCSQQMRAKSVNDDNSTSDSYTKEQSDMQNYDSTDSFYGEYARSQSVRSLAMPYPSDHTKHNMQQHLGLSISNLLGPKFIGDRSLPDHMSRDVNAYKDVPKRIGKLVQHRTGLWSWESPPKRVVLVTKPNDIESEWHLKHIFAWFFRKSITVYVDPLIAQRYTGITAFDPDLVSSSKIDLVISIGGDGTLLYINSLFQLFCPPILAFNCGSLGFLTPFSPKDIDKKLSFLFDSPISITERTRLSAVVISSNNMQQQTSSQLPSITQTGSQRHAQVSQGKKVYTVLNEISLMRQESKDASDPICTLDTYINSRYVTTVQGDGALVSTPSGSTAYALSAGGIPVHPTLNCMLLTFICPHVMSGRQVCLPSDCTLKLKQPRDSRGSCAVAFDNRMRLELLRGESIEVQVAKHCFPTINEQDSNIDWFRALVRCLGWNARIRQKAFDARNAVREKDVGDTDSDES